jgi:glutathione S-transferase
MLTLLDRGVSGNCWRVRLLLGFLGLPYQRIEVDILSGENRSALFRRINPRGQVPVLLVDGEPGTRPIACWDSGAILVYLAARHAPQWLGYSPVEQAYQQQWLSIAGVEHQVGIRAARGALLFALEPAGFTLAAAQQIGRTGLEVMNSRLASSIWLCGERPTVADVACYPYARLARQAGISADDLSALLLWFERVEALPGYVSLDDPDAAPSRPWADAVADLERAFQQERS